MVPPPLAGSVSAPVTRSRATPPATDAATAASPPTRSRRRRMPASVQSGSWAGASRSCRARLSTNAGDGVEPPGCAARRRVATCIAAESSPAGDRGGRRLAISALTKRVRGRSAFDMTNSGSRGATKRSQLQHLGVGDAHAHRRSGFPYGVPPEESELEHTPIILRQAVENRADVHVTLWFGGGSGVALFIELHEYGPVPLSPDIGEHAACGGPQVGADLSRGDVGAEPRQRTEEGGRGHVLGIRGVAGS